ncbi:GNAT family N-acetyltransferase [Spongiimicrobium sp. 3-5]|uniref:GNAT family N-acetyltransferase n=1 Tax=Spongiimicrobium sp. 3-5 TaxID=3332596 RepID=UPI00397EF863
MNLKQRNIDNLTSLWKLVNRRANAYVVGDIFDYGIVNYSDWPNRLWFINRPNQGDLDLVKKTISTATTKITVPYWDIDGNDYEPLLKKNGFEKVLEQVGMATDLTKGNFIPSEIDLNKVKDEGTALLWESLFEKAFNYKINHKLLLKSYGEIDYLIAYDKTSPVGTALMYCSGKEVVGIHSMGIIPEMRRKGYAERMMHSMLYEAVDKGYNYAVLQASAMGKGLYEKLGFEEQFLMRNYVLPQHV